MALKFKKGDVVRHKVPVIRGVIVDRVIVDGDDDINYLVEFKREDGTKAVTQMRESELE